MEMTLRGYIRSSEIAARRLRTVFEEERIFPSRRALSQVCWGFLNKAFQVHRATLTLCKARLGSEAYALSRTLVEMFIALRWVTNDDQETRARQYGLFSAKRKAYWAKVGSKYYPNDPGWKDAVKRQQQVIDRFAARYKSFTFWGDIADKLKGMAKESELLETPPSQAHALWDYEFPYSMASDHVHATVVATDDFMPDVGDPFCVSSRPGNSDAKNAVWTATSYLFKIAWRVDLALKLDLNQKIGKAIDRFTKRSRT